MFLLAKIGEVVLYIRLIEKSFPEYKVIIPAPENKTSELFLEKELLRPTLKRMLIISTENNRPVVFSFKNNSLNIFTELQMIIISSLRINWMGQNSVLWPNSN